AWFERGIDPALKGRIEGLLARRQEARGRRDFAAADAIREELASLDVEVMDTPSGAQWKRRERA
ncbi:MAG: CysS/YqeB C-terminal domain-containing protein, partial [Caulobacteraceae bacterium]